MKPGGRTWNGSDFGADPDYGADLGEFLKNEYRDLYEKNQSNNIYDQVRFSADLDNVIYIFWGVTLNILYGNKSLYPNLYVREVRHLREVKMYISTA